MAWEYKTLVQHYPSIPKRFIRHMIHTQYNKKETDAIIEIQNVEKENQAP